MTGPHRVWTAQEDEWLRMWWGHHSAKKIGEGINRTAAAVISRGVKVLKLGSPKRGYLSLAELERTSGYHYTTILTAARRIGVQLRRQPEYQKTTRKRKRKRPGRGIKKYGKHYAITQEQADRILEELAKRPDGKRRSISYRGEWGGPNKPAACVICGKTERPHCSKGRCDRCDARERRREKKVRRCSKGGRE